MKYRFQTYYKRYLNSELLKNTTVLITGTIFAQLIPILLQPFLRRYFTPEIFGAYSVYMSLLGIIISISSLKYELTIVLPEKDYDSVNVLGLSVIISLLFSSLLFAIICIWKESNLRFLNLDDKYAIYLYMLPLGVFLYSTYQSMNYWLIRKKAFFKISLNKIVRRGTEGASQAGLAFFKITSGLIIGDIIGNFFNVFSGYFQIYKTGADLKSINLSMMKYVGKKYFDFPKYNLIPGFTSAFSYLAPAIFINKFYSAEYTGYFDLSKLLLSIPLALIASSISNVLLQRVSERFKNSQNICKELIAMLVPVITIASVEIISITFLGEEIFTLIFGKQWLMSGIISKLMVWSFAFNFIVASFSSVYIALNKVKSLSIWQLIYFVSILTLYFLKNSTYLSFIKVYVAIEVISSILNILLLIWIINQYEKRLKK